MFLLQELFINYITGIQFTKAVAAKSKSTNHMLVVHLVSQIYGPILFTMGARKAMIFASITWLMATLLYTNK
jgi:hypothetical protein